jgi:poly(3-hydroxybutyrate) depolymerase
MSVIKRINGRFYRLHVPTGVKKNSPLVLVFHGGGSDPVAVEWESRFSEVANQHKFVVAYLAGTNRRAFIKDRFLYWNDGRPYADGSPNPIDDVTYTSKVIDHIARSVSIDQSRVHAAGYSNGAQFCCRLAQQLSNRIRSIACLTTQRNPDEHFGLPKRKISYMFVGGLYDHISPLSGGPSPYDNEFTTVLPVYKDHLLNWVDFNNSQFINTKQIGETVRANYKNDVENILVESWIGKGGHNWPGGNSEGAFLGPMNNDFWCAEEMWKFFEKT